MIKRTIKVFRRSKKERAKASFLKLNLSELLETFALQARAPRYRLDKDSVGPIVSLTSFPARIDSAWIPIECMFQQTLQPSRIILVLSREEFPGTNLPKALRKQQERGLEILWIERNIRSYGKFLPVKRLHPDRDIVTIDDDLFYERNLLAKLVDAAQRHPKAIIGQRGWEIGFERDALLPYRQWSKARLESPPELTFLTGVGGIYYPAEVDFCDKLLDEDLAMKICPTGDDIWFWAMARLRNVPAVCLGNNGIRPIRRLQDGPKLWTLNGAAGGNDKQLADLFSRFPALSDNLQAYLITRQPKQRSCHATQVDPWARSGS